MAFLNKDVASGACQGRAHPGVQSSRVVIVVDEFFKHSIPLGVIQAPSALSTFAANIGPQPIADAIVRVLYLLDAGTG